MQVVWADHSESDGYDSVALILPLNDRSKLTRRAGEIDPPFRSRKTNEVFVRYPTTALDLHF